MPRSRSGSVEGKSSKRQVIRAMTPQTNINNLVNPFLTDLYQITMAYAYWKPGKHRSYATFDLFFRKNPFGGEFTIFTGIEEVILFLQDFKYTDEQIAYIKSVMPDTTGKEFFDYLRNLTTDGLTVYALPEGTTCFPSIPLLRVDGPVLLCQLLETTLLNLVNFASLITTNAARYRIASGPNIELIEMGIRRAQGPDGAMTASKYAYIGGFDSTSNVQAGKIYDIPVKGTHAHSWVMAWENLDEIPIHTLKRKRTTEDVNFVQLCIRYRQEISAPGILTTPSAAVDGEFVAFIMYAISFPDSFLALIDTYDVMRSGIPNFLAVAMALTHCGYLPLGVRIDSGDLAWLSYEVYKAFVRIAQLDQRFQKFVDFKIVASNDISVGVITTLMTQQHKINCFGIGTHLVTCKKEPALGGVYKLAQLDAKPKMKLSPSKTTIPCKKRIYRLYGNDGKAILDLMQLDDEPPPRQGVKVLCLHPFNKFKKAYVTPSRVDNLLQPVWKNGKRVSPSLPLEDVREEVKRSIQALRNDMVRFKNPTPFKVSLSEKLFKLMHQIWEDKTPAGELK